jgi:aldehyde:ferredoxin oxidoreductase
MEILPFDRAAEVIEATTGLKTSAYEVRRIGAGIVNIERAFNVREGIRRSDDNLPRRFKEEMLTEGLSKNTLFDQEPMLDEYYAERGWNPETGIPRIETLKELGLEDVAEEMIKLGILSPE